MSILDECPSCHADLRLKPAPDRLCNCLHPDVYPETGTCACGHAAGEHDFLGHCQVPVQGTGGYYTEVIGVEIRGVYDGVLFWQCPKCDHRYHQWRPESRRAAAAEGYGAKPYDRSSA
jgi:hypothetical protein